jgi:hypothetical protein
LNSAVKEVNGGTGPYMHAPVFEVVKAQNKREVKRHVTWSKLSAITEKVDQQTTYTIEWPK